MQLKAPQKIGKNGRKKFQNPSQSQ